MEIVSGADQSLHFALPNSLLGLLLSFLQLGAQFSWETGLCLGAEDDPMGDVPPAPALLGVAGL